MARGGGCSIPVMVMSKQTSISDDTAATAAHYSGQRFRGAGWVGLGVQNVMLSELLPSLALFFFCFIPKAMSMWSQSRPPRNNAADPRADTFTVGEVGRGGMEGAHHWELGKSHVCEMMIQLMAA